MLLPDLIWDTQKIGYCRNDTNLTYVLRAVQYCTLSPSPRCAGSRSAPLRRVVAEAQPELEPLEHHDAVLALRTLLEHLKPDNLDAAVAIAALPLEIRGYEELKLARVNEYRQTLAEQLARFLR